MKCKQIEFCYFSETFSQQFSTQQIVPPSPRRELGARGPRLEARIVFGEVRFCQGHTH